MVLLKRITSPGCQRRKLRPRELRWLEKPLSWFRFLRNKKTFYTHGGREALPWLSGTHWRLTQQRNSGVTRLSHLRDEEAECCWQTSVSHCLRTAPSDVRYLPLPGCQVAGSVVLFLRQMKLPLREMHTQAPGVSDSPLVLAPKRCKEKEDQQHLLTLEDEKKNSNPGLYGSKCTVILL